MFKLKLKDLDNFLLLVSQNNKVYAPINKQNTTDFRLFSSNSKIDIETVKTAKSPKNFLFSCYENIASYTLKDKEILVNELNSNIEDFVIFGIRACDQKSFEILDKVFLSEPIDSFYEERRKKAIIISIACQKFEENCFCTNFDIKPFDPNGDVVCFKNNEDIYFQPKTSKGENFLNKYSNQFINIGFDLEQFKSENKKIFDYMPLKNLNLNKFKNEDMLTIFNNEKWEELSKTCLGCGSCTFFCPTCQCYDIRDFKNGNEVTRYRCYDSCMYSDFTLVAGGGNPRKTQKERFRQRFMHKLVYFPKNNDGEFGCVGCGRCLKVCPNSLNIVKVIKNIGE